MVGRDRKGFIFCLKCIRKHDRSAFSQVDIAYFLDGRVVDPNAVRLWRERWRGNTSLCKTSLFRVDAAAKGDRWESGVLLGVNVVGCCAYALVHLALDVPFFPIILRHFRGQVDVLEVKDHLHTDVPELFLQIDSNQVLVSALVVKPIDNCSLLRRAERAWFSLYYRVPA